MSWTFLIGLLIIFAVPGAWLCLVFLCGVVLDWNDRLDEQDQRDDSRSSKSSDERARPVPIEIWPDVGAPRAAR